MSKMGNNVIFFGSYGVDKEMVRWLMGMIIFWPFILLIALKPPVSPVTTDLSLVKTYSVIQAETAAELVAQLKKFDLWHLAVGDKITPVVLNRYPDDLYTLTIDKRKKVFLHSLLPIVLVALEELKRERAALVMIIDRLADYQVELYLIDNLSDFNDQLTESEIAFLHYLAEKYRTTWLPELLNRVDLLPVSLVLAQGVLESAWGSSRFVIEGNNVFGVWTWGQKGMIPARRIQGKNHKVAVYSSLLESVRAYLLMLNRVSAYNRLRDIRRYNNDSLVLVDGLLYFSEKRERYIAAVRRVIIDNNLRRYDNFLLFDGRS